ncbi:MAG: site-specific integrase [Nitrososphaerota archaeon]|nr:site-specific integrase [Nitrososphaerota archaeon]
MRGHITKRYNRRYKNLWTIVIELGYDPQTKKRKQRWFSFRGTKVEADKRLTELLRQLDTGSFINPGKTTLGEYLDKWLKDYKPNLSPRGFERYQSIINKSLIPELGRITLTQLKPEHVQNYYTAMEDKGASTGTVRYHHAVLHVALQTAVKWGLLARNVANAVTPPKPHNGEMETWDEDEMNRFLEFAKDTIYYELFYTGLYTGMRRSELLGLRWEDVDLDFLQIRVVRGLHQLRDGSYVFTEPKSAKSRRTIALTPSNASLLREYLEKRKQQCAMLGTQLTDDSLVFCHLDGKPLRPNTVTRAFKEGFYDGKEDIGSA